MSMQNEKKKITLLEDIKINSRTSELNKCKVMNENCYVMCVICFHPFILSRVLSSFIDFIFFLSSYCSCSVPGPGTASSGTRYEVA